LTLLPVVKESYFHSAYYFYATQFYCHN